MLEPIFLKNQSFISSSDLTQHEILSVLDLAEKFKKGNCQINLKNKVLGMIFEKASTRTRVSFKVAMSRLGGSSIDLNPDSSQIGRGEPIKDTARVLGRYCDALAIRTFNQEDIEEYAKWSSKPVINALSDLEHPCQVLADFLTIKEHFGDFRDLVLTFVGDGNNVANSLILCGSILGIKVKIACPKGFEPNPQIIKESKLLSKDRDLIEIYNDPLEAVSGSKIIYTDVWSSMGEEHQKENKDKEFDGFTVNENLLKGANENVIVLHCLPAYRGKEITDEIIEGKHSKIFDQAENRLHVQQALLYCLLSKKLA